MQNHIGRGISMSSSSNRSFTLLLVALAVVSLFLWKLASASENAVLIPRPAVDAPLASTPGKQTAVVAGGCFWGTQAVFQHVKGVKSVTAGYSGGSSSTAEYEVVSTGKTGHAESVQITFDPSQISYG